MAVYDAWAGSWLTSWLTSWFPEEPITPTNNVIVTMGEFKAPLTTANLTSISMVGLIKAPSTIGILK